MPIKVTKLGPGTLTLGAAAQEVSAQLTSCTVSASETVSGGTDEVKVLSGEKLAAEDGTPTYAFTLAGTFLQDLGDVASVVDFSWTNMGTDQAFVFTPNTAAGTTVTGTLVPVPLAIGGDEADANMASDFTWRIKGTPALT